MEWTVEEINNIKKKVNERARTDKDFRDLCLINPEQAIEQITDKTLPAGFKVRFIENKDAHFTHVLPDYVDSSGELSDDELHQVAGGSDPKTRDYCFGCRSDLGFDRVDHTYVKCRNCGGHYYKPS